MNIIFTYEPEFYKRIMFAVIVDNRSNIPEIKNRVGSVIQSYVDSQTEFITESVLFYKLETLDGNLVGYIALQTTENGAFLLTSMLRPNFQPFNEEIIEKVNNFIISGLWAADKL